MGESLADQAVAALAAVAAIPTAGLDRPERHQARALKRAAETTLADAFRQARVLAAIADDLSALVSEVRSTEALRITGPAEKGQS